MDSDFETFKKFTIETYYEKEIPSTAFVKIENFCGEKYISNKVKKFACRSLPGKGVQSRIRIIFIYEELKNLITFVEIYYKGDKSEEDHVRLKTAIENL